MKYNEKTMNEVLNAILLPEEENRCPVYCVFRDTGFFAGNMQSGFITCTSNGRLLFARQYITCLDQGALSLSMIKKLKIKRTIFGQYAVSFVFFGEKKDIRLQVQISPWMFIGKDNFPNQARNIETLLSILRRYEK